MQIIEKIQILRKIKELDKCGRIHQMDLMEVLDAYHDSIKFSYESKYTLASVAIKHTYYIKTRGLGLSCTRTQETSDIDAPVVIYGFEIETPNNKLRETGTERAKSLYDYAYSLFLAKSVNKNKVNEH